MSIAVRHRGDISPTLAPVTGLSVSVEADAEVMAKLQNKSPQEMAQRFADGHRAYVAWTSGERIAWGWVATRRARIGELDFTFPIARGDRYLWNFVTLPTHRGMGIYSRLLDAIVRAELADANRFWVAYAPENHASGAGIRTAGFIDVASLSFDALGRPAVHDIMTEGAQVAAAFLGLPPSDDELAHCWRCAKRAAPTLARCHIGPCSCDYQQPIVICAGANAA